MSLVLSVTCRCYTWFRVACPSASVSFFLLCCAGWGFVCYQGGNSHMAIIHILTFREAIPHHFISFKTLQGVGRINARKSQSAHENQLADFRRTQRSSRIRLSFSRCLRMTWMLGNMQRSNVLYI